MYIIYEYVGKWRMCTSTCVVESVHLLEDKTEIFVTEVPRYW